MYGRFARTGMSDRSAEAAHSPYEELPGSDRRIRQYVQNPSGQFRSDSMDQNSRETRNESREQRETKNTTTVPWSNVSSVEVVERQNFAPRNEDNQTKPESARQDRFNQQGRFNQRGRFNQQATKVTQTPTEIKVARHQVNRVTQTPQETKLTRHQQIQTENERRVEYIPVLESTSAVELVASKGSSLSNKFNGRKRNEPFSTASHHSLPPELDVFNPSTTEGSALSVLPEQHSPQAQKQRRVQYIPVVETTTAVEQLIEPSDRSNQCGGIGETPSSNENSAVLPASGRSERTVHHIPVLEDIPYFPEPTEHNLISPRTNSSAQTYKSTKWSSGTSELVESDLRYQPERIYSDEQQTYREYSYNYEPVSNRKAPASDSGRTVSTRGVTGSNTTGLYEVCVSDVATQSATGYNPKNLTPCTAHAEENANQLQPPNRSEAHYYDEQNYLKVERPPFRRYRYPPPPPLTPRPERSYDRQSSETSYRSRALPISQSSRDYRSNERPPRRQLVRYVYPRNSDLNCGEVTADGVIILRLGLGVNIYLTVGGNLQLTDQQRRVTSSFSPKTGRQGMTHPYGCAYRTPDFSQIMCIEPNGDYRFAKLQKGSVSFTTLNCAVTYVVDQTGTKTSVSKMSNCFTYDFCRNIFEDSEDIEPYWYNEAVKILELAQYDVIGPEHIWKFHHYCISWNVVNNFVCITWGINKMTFCQSTCVLRAEIKDVIYTACLSDIHSFIRAKDQRVYYNGEDFSARSSGRSSYIDKFGHVKISA